MTRPVKSTAIFVIGMVLCAVPAWSHELPAPTFLFSSGSARLLGMGDASVALVDASGYQSNPGALALSFEDESVRSNVNFNPETSVGSSFSSAFFGFSGRNVLPRIGRWRLAVAYAQQSAHVQGSVDYFGTSYPGLTNSPDEPIGRYTSLSSIPGRGVTRSITLSMCNPGIKQLGFGLTVRRDELKSRSLFPYSDDKALTAWSFDVGLLFRHTVILRQQSDNSRVRTITLSPSYGVSMVNLIRTKLVGYTGSVDPYSTNFLLSRIPLIDLPPPDGFVVGPRLSRWGAALGLSVDGPRVPWTEITTALEYQAGDELYSGARVGAELSILSSAAVRFGYGQMGIHEEARSFGFTLSTVGLQKMILHHQSFDPTGSVNRENLWQKIHISVSYVTMTAPHDLYVVDLPDNYWSISVSM